MMQQDSDELAIADTARENAVSAQNRILETVVFLILGLLGANSANSILQVIAERYIQVPSRKILFFLCSFVTFTGIFALLVWLSTEHPGGKPF